jgi:hypothetical protein
MPIMGKGILRIKYSNKWTINKVKYLKEKRKVE